MKAKRSRTRELTSDEVGKGGHKERPLVRRSEEGGVNVIFGEIRDLILENQEIQQQIYKGNYSRRLIYAEDVIPTLAKRKKVSEDVVETELKEALVYASTLCFNVQGLSPIEFLVRECRFLNRPVSNTKKSTSSS